MIVFVRVALLALLVLALTLAGCARPPETGSAPQGDAPLTEPSAPIADDGYGVGGGPPVPEPKQGVAGQPVIYEGLTLDMRTSQHRPYQIEVTVTGIECGQTDFPHPFPGVEAPPAQSGHQYCTLVGDVTNTGDIPVRFSGHESILIDTQGREYNPHQEASIDQLYNIGGDENYLRVASEGLNPGAQAKLVVAFNVPADIAPARVIVLNQLGDAGLEITLP